MDMDRTETDLVDETVTAQGSQIKDKKGDEEETRQARAETEQKQSRDRGETVQSVLGTPGC